MSAPTIYEVNLSVEASIIDAYQRWLQAHIAEIVALPGFVGAKLYQVAGASEGRVELCVHYLLEDDAALERYLLKHAPRLRADGVAHFGEQFRATRRVMHAHELI